MDLSEEEKELYRNMGNNLATIRGSHSQEEIAKVIGMKTSNYNTIEGKKGERHLKDNQIIKLAQYYNVSADYLLGLTEETTTDKDIKYFCSEYGLTEKALNNLKMFNDFEKKKGLKQFGVSTLDTINSLLEEITLICLIDSYFNLEVNQNLVLGFLNHGDIAVYDKTKNTKMMGFNFIFSEQIEEVPLLLIQKQLSTMKEKIKKKVDNNERSRNNKK